MAVGLSGVIVTFLVFDYENGFDRDHKNTAQVFRVNCNRIIEGETQKWGVVPSALGSTADNEFQSIEESVRYGYTHSFLVQYEDIIHREAISYADKNFFELFSLKLKSGQLEVFKDKSAVIISAQFAEKYFGVENPNWQVFEYSKK